ILATPRFFSICPPDLRYIHLRSNPAPCLHRRTPHGQELLYVLSRHFASRCNRSSSALCRSATSPAAASAACRGTTPLPAARQRRSGLHLQGGCDAIRLDPEGS